MAQNNNNSNNNNSNNNNNLPKPSLAAVFAAVSSGNVRLSKRIDQERFAANVRNLIEAQKKTTPSLVPAFPVPSQDPGFTPSLDAMRCFQSAGVEALDDVDESDDESNDFDEVPIIAGAPATKKPKHTAPPAATSFPTQEVIKAGAKTIWCSLLPYDEHDGHLYCYLPREINLQGNLPKSHNHKLSVLVGDALKSSDIKRHFLLCHYRTYSQALLLEKHNEKWAAFAKEIFEKCLKQKKQTTTDFSVNLYGDSSKHATQCLHLLLMLAENDLPASLVESSSFHNFIQSCGAQEFPGRTFMTTNVLPFVKRWVIGEIYEFTSKAPAATPVHDMWTDPQFDGAFLGLNVCVGDPKTMNPYCFMTDLIRVTVSHTAENLATIIGEALYHRMPEDQILIGPTSDGAAVAYKTSLVLLNTFRNPEKMKEFASQTSDQMRQYQDVENVCFAHKLSRMWVVLIEKLENDGSFLKKIKAITNLLNVTPAMKEKLQNALERLHRPALQPINSVETRFFSACDMVTRFLDILPGIDLMNLEKAFDDYTFNYPNVLDLQMAREFVSICHPFQLVSLKSEAEHHITISAIPSLVGSLKSSVCINDGDSAFVRKLKTILQIELEERFGNLSTDPQSPALIAAALHPSYGNLGFLSGSMKDRVWGHVENWWLEFAYKNLGTMKKNCTLSLFKTTFRVGATKDCSTLRQEFESPSHMKDYNITGFVPEEITSKFKLFWGEKNEEDTLKPVALAFCCIPSTSASVERVFSTAGRIKCDLRSQLGDVNFEAFVVVSRFFKSKYAKERKSIDKITQFLMQAYSDVQNQLKNK